MKNWPSARLAKFLLILLLLPVTLTGYCQNNNLLKINNKGNTEAITFTEKETEFIKEFYSERIEAPMELINGKEYEPYYLRSKSKPLLFPDRKRKATIVTKTRQYINITLDYDTYLDQVVFTDISKNINFRFPQIALNKDIVDAFWLYFENDSLYFRNLREADCSGMNIKEGFYEIAYTGKSRYIIRHTSSFYMREGLNEYKYFPENYFSVGGAYYEIKNRRTLLRLFGDDSDKVKKYIHASRIRVSKADKDQFKSILKFYDSLNNPVKKTG
jgi:hypothetical protein